jgi:predicted peroxiredoxin
VLWVVLGCQQEKPDVHTHPVAETSDGVFIHITSGPENPHRVLMALQMATLMVEGGRDVLVYADIEGVRCFLTDSEDLQFKEFLSSQTQIASLIESGVPIMVCPGCLKAAEKGPEDLMAGVDLATKEAFFDFTGGRILTLDY